MKRITLPAKFRPYHGNVVVNRYSRFLLFFVMLLMGYTAKSQIYHYTGWENNLDGWQSSGNAGSYNASTSNACSGNQSVRANIYYGNNSILTSPALSVSDGSEATFTYTFKVTQYSSSTTPASAGDFTLDVQWTNDLSGTWTTLETIDDSNYVSTTDCAERTVTFTPANGDTVYVRFFAEATDGEDLYIYFDDVTVSQITCVPPAELTLNNLITGEVSWTAPDSAPASGYEYYLATANAAPDSGTVATGTTTEVSATLTTSPSTQYYFWVRSNCGGDLSPWAGPLTFFTAQVPASLPFEEDFEASSNWTLSNGEQTNKWYISTAVNNGGSSSLYISNDNGATNSYDTEVTSRVHAFRDIQLPADAMQLRLSFDWKGEGEYSFGTYYDYLKVWAVPVTFVPTPGSTISSSDGILIANYLANNPTDFQTAEYLIDVEEYAGEAVRLVFEWRNDGSDGGDSSVAIDNVSIVQVTCFPPDDLEDVVTTENVTLSWSAAEPVPASGYDYYYSTENTAPIEATEPTGNVAETNVVLAGLDANTTYYYWVRSNCGGSVSEWASGGSFHTECEIATLPYVYDFTGYTGNEGSTCWKEQTGELGTAVTLTGTSSSWTNGNYNNSSSNPNGTAALINLYATDNDWIISPALDLGDGSVTYQLEFDASIIPWSGSDVVTDMEDKYGQVVISTDGGLTWDEANVLVTFDNDNIPAGGAHQIISLEGYTGVVRIGFYGYSEDNAPDLRFYIDNFKVDVQPDCALPESLVFEGATENSVSVSWSAPETAPENGYEYFIADFDTAPEPDFAPADSTEQTEATIGGLNAGETYYFWVRSFCAVGVFSEWVGPFEVKTLCDSPDIESVDATSVCGIGASVITADVSGGTVKWYTQETGGAAIATGETFETPELTENTTYYVTAVNEGTAQDGGARASTTSTSYTSPFDYGLIFDVYSDFTLNSVDVYISDDTANELTIVLTNSNDEELETITVELPAGDYDTPVQHTINLGWEITAGTGYKIFAEEGPDMVRESGLGGFPYAIGDVGAVTSGYSFSSTSDSYYYFYNWDFTAGCAAARVAVEVEVTEAPEVALTASNEAICEGENTTLTATSDNEGYTYVWMPGNLEGAEQTVTLTETTVYTVTATDEVSGCVATQTITVNVNPLPADFDLGADMEICANDGAVAITAQGGTVEAVIMEEGFNEPTNNWTTINNSTGGTVANAAWTLREDGYVIPGYSAVSSNDDSQFYMSNSDNQGLGSTTSTILMSPVFSTEGYQEVSVAFYHFFREPSAGSSEGTVEVSLNGTDWTILETFDSNEGDYEEFASESIALTEAFLGQETVYVRFKFEGDWRYFWAIDNVSVSGSQEGVVTWEPTEGLYLDEEATIAYTEGVDAQVVYTLPENTVEYTATVTSPFGCTATATVEVTPIQADLPVVTTEQEFCNSATVADLTADGNDIQWYAGETGGESLTEETALETATYYVSQLVNGCESARVAVAVTLNVTPAVEGDEMQDIEVENGYVPTIEDIEVTGVEGGDITWYANEEDALAGENPLAEGTEVENETTYYAVQTVNGCSSEPFAVTVTITLDSKEFDLASFTYWPNPVKDVLSISYSSQITTVKVYNMVGQEVLSQKVNALEGTINMGALQDGTYLVNVATDTATKTIRVIKKQ